MSLRNFAEKEGVIAPATRDLHSNFWLEIRIQQKLAIEEVS
jgi:hypothetical protein